MINGKTQWQYFSYADFLFFIFSIDPRPVLYGVDGNGKDLRADKIKQRYPASLFAKDGSKIGDKYTGVEDIMCGNLVFVWHFEIVFDSLFGDVDFVFANFCMKYLSDDPKFEVFKMFH